MTEIEDMDPLARDVPVWTAEQYRDARGTEIGVTSWQEVSQERVSAFGVATEDRNYIHMTPEKARSQAGLPGTIAHGLFTLSLLPSFNYEVTPMAAGAVLGLNYGFDKVRWIAPVPVGARVRGRMTLADAEPKNGSLVITIDVTVEIEGQEVAAGGKPALVAR
ncbi:MAG: MaoC family dehydratase, partial [Pseudomonadota bacterium]